MKLPKFDLIPKICPSKSLASTTIIAMMGKPKQLDNNSFYNQAIFWS